MALPGNRPSGGTSKTSAPALPGAPPAATGGGLPGVKPSAGKVGSKSSKKDKGFLGVNLPKLPFGGPDLPALGVTTDRNNPLTQVSNLVKGAGPGLLRLGGTLLSEARAGQAQGGLVGALGRTGSVAEAVNPLSRANREAARAAQPISYQLMTSPARTLRQIPDTAGAVLPGGPGFGQSNLVRQVKEEGVLGTGLAKVADVATLFGGVGAVGKAAGAGRLARAAELERLAGLTSEAAKLGKVADEFKLAKAAQAADAAGDGAKALDLARAADQAAEASRLRAAVAAAGKGVRAAERTTEFSTKAARLGGRVAAAPFVPTTKALGLAGKGIGALAKTARFAPYVSRINEALGNLERKRGVDDLFHNEVRAPLQAELHNLFQRHGIETAARNLSADEQAAIYLSKAKQGLTPGARRALDAIDTVPEEVRPDVIRSAFGGGDVPDAQRVTPERLRLARAFEDGTLDPKQQAKMQKAADALSEVQGRREQNIYVTGEGTSRQLSDEALENRAARARGESAPMDIEAAKETRTPTIEQQRAGQSPRKVSTLRGRLAQIRAEIDELNTGGETRTIWRNGDTDVPVEVERSLGKGPDGREYVKVRGSNTGIPADEIAYVSGPEPAPLSRAQERATAKYGERVRRSTAILKEEQRRGSDRVGAAQRKLEQHQSAERAARDRFERENQVRADRAEQKRFDTLQKQETKALDDIARAEEEARNSIEAAPPQDRPALRTNYEIKRLMLDLAEAHPDRASEFKALADDIETNKADLDRAGIKTEYFFGGKAAEKPVTVPPTATLRRARKLQSERNRVSGVLERDIQTQTEKYATETRDMLYNKFRGRLQETAGSTIGKEFEPGRFATGEELGRMLADEKMVAWDPKTGARITDPKLLTRDTAVLPEALYNQLTKYTGAGRGGFIGGALKVYDKATGKWKHSVLALSPRWNVGNIVGNVAMATVGAGLTPAQIVANGNEARRLVKAFENGEKIPPEHEAALRRLLSSGYHATELTDETGRLALARNRVSQAVEGEGTSRVRSAAAHPISKSYAFNEYIDSVNRTMIYLAKKKTGISAEAAVQLALKAAGDFNKMTPFERNVVRRIIPFYAWQRHITRLAFSLPIEAPARVAWTLHLAELENRLKPDPATDPNSKQYNQFAKGTIPVGGKRLNVSQFNPFSSSFWTDPTFRGAGYQVNPLLKAGVAGLTGYNLGKMKPVSGKFRPDEKGRPNRVGSPSGFGTSPEIMAAKSPAAFAAFLAQQVPQVGVARDLIAGKVPVRYDTGEPRKVGPGASKKNAKPTLTGRGRKETVARFFGVPIPEPEQTATTKKKR